MTHFVFWAIGLVTLWVGLRFDDEALLIVFVLVGAVFIIGGLIAAPLPIQLFIEVSGVLALFSACMQCIERG